MADEIGNIFMAKFSRNMLGVGIELSLLQSDMKNQATMLET